MNEIETGRPFLNLVTSGVNPWRWSSTRTALCRYPLRMASSIRLRNWVLMLSCPLRCMSLSASVIRVGWGNLPCLFRGLGGFGTRCNENSRSARRMAWRYRGVWNAPSCSWSAGAGASMSSGVSMPSEARISRVMPARSVRNGFSAGYRYASSCAECTNNAFRGPWC